MIPIQLDMDPHEASLAHITTTCSMYWIIHRHAYLPLIQIWKHVFDLHMYPFLGDASDVWISWGNVMLPWHLPVGVIYDVLQVEEMPWKWTIHTTFHSPMIPDGSVEHVHAVYMAQLKQSDVLRFGGKRRRFMGLDQKEVYLDTLWNISQPEYYQDERNWRKRWEEAWDEYREVNNQVNGRLMTEEDGTVSWDIRHVPLRWYVVDNAKDAFTTWDNVNIVQGLVGYSASLTIGEARRKVLPGLKEVSRMVTQGVQVEEDVSVAWMLEKLVYADNFVHIVVFTA